MNDKRTDQLWPPPDYYRQLDCLRAAIGQTVYLAELRDTAMNAGVKISDEGVRLLAVVEFPEPDPYRQLCPHMLILDDGRGVNLGRIVRISVREAFGPAAENILYQNYEFLQDVLFAPRRLSRDSLSHTSKQIFSRMLGPQPGRLLAECHEDKSERLDTPVNQPDAPDTSGVPAKNSGG